MDGMPDVMLVTREETREFIDREAHRVLGVGREELVARYDAGELDMSDPDVFSLCYFFIDHAR